MYTYVHCYFSKLTFSIHFLLVYPYFSSLSIIILVVVDTIEVLKGLGEDLGWD